jgi:hypothetical protein
MDSATWQHMCVTATWDIMGNTLIMIMWRDYDCRDSCDKSAIITGSIVASVVLVLISVFAMSASYKFMKRNKNYAYEAPVNIRCTISNALTIASIPITFVQFFVLVMGSQAEWSK